jgi:maleylpyruvate isomerase
MRLYGYWRSSSSWRVRIALHLKGIAFDYVPVHLLHEGGEHRRDDHRARNPMEQVPVLELVTPDGQRWHLAQSLAILEYLEEVKPDPPLLPRDPLQRARVRELAEIVNAGVQPFQNLAVQQHVKELGGDPAAWTRHYVGKGLAALEARARVTAGRYLVGDEVSFADACLVPQLYSARRFGVELTACPTLVRIDAALAELPAFQAAHADRQPDAQPQP